MSLVEALPWQEAQWRRLLRARNERRLPHALLLRGPRGVGKRLFAERLAASLLCLDPGVDGEPCAACRGCHLYQAATHPDLKRIQPAEPGKPVTVDNIRAFCEHNISLPQLAPVQILLLLDADAMNPAAANAFLKTLEEPARESLLILVASHPERLPATIRSRCQALDFAPPSEAEATLAWLGGDSQQAAIALAIAAGAPLRARELLEAQRLAQRADALQQWLSVVSRRSDPVALAAQWLELDAAWLGLWWRGWLLDIAALAVSDTPPRLFNPDRRDDLQAVVNALDLARLHRLLERIVRLGDADGQLNRQLLLERLLIDSTHLTTGA